MDTGLQASDTSSKTSNLIKIMVSENLSMEEREQILSEIGAHDYSHQQQNSIVMTNSFGFLGISNGAKRNSTQVICNPVSLKTRSKEILSSKEEQIRSLNALNTKIERQMAGLKTSSLLSMPNCTMQV